MKKSIITAVCMFAIILCSVVSNAQPHHRGGPHKMHPRHKALLQQLSEEDRKALKQEMKAYDKTNVMPVIKAERKKLDQELNSIDQRKVAALQAEIRAMKPQFKALRESKKEAFRSGEKPNEALREQMKELVVQKRAIGDKAKPIVEKYDTEITTHLEALKENHKQWRADKEAIMKKYFDKAGIEMPVKDPRGGEHPHKGAWGEKGKDGCKKGEMPEGCCTDGKIPEGCCAGGAKEGCSAENKKPHMSPKHRGGAAKKVHFLLMNPDDNTPFEMEDNSFNNTVEEGAELTNVFPNPAAAEYQTLEYTMKKEGAIKIDILTRDGGFVKTVLNDTKPAGKYALQVDISDLKDEIYLYTITDHKGKTKTKRFLIQRDR